MASMASGTDSTGTIAPNNRRSKTPSYVLNQDRRAALAEVDNAKFAWFHVKVCCTAGAGFFTVAYDIFAINIATRMLGYVYGHATGPDLTSNQQLGLKIATPIGTLFGQLLFGWLADVVGRKRMYGIELIIIIVASFFQALCGSAPVISIIGVLIIWRFIMGVGAGGDYPLSAVISSEFASTRVRGRLMNAVFAFQGWGNFVAVLVALVITASFKDSILHDTSGTHRPVDYMWRILIGLGCVPGCVALYFRLTIPETPRFIMDVDRNIRQASKDIENLLTVGKSEVDPDAVVQRVEAPRASWADFCAHFSQWENLKVLIGTSWSWFAVDIAFYGLNLNAADILEKIGFGSDKVYDNLWNICVKNLILSASLIPGYWVCFLFIDSWGRRPIQLMGFSVLTIIFICMGAGYGKLTSSDSLKKIVPGEAFPTRYRSTAHGISAASGKLGAIIAQVGFSHLYIGTSLCILAAFMFTGILSTLLIPETKGRSLEELSNENQDEFVKGIAGTAGVRDEVIV
ncbi:hypothetical protein D9758_012570 [Tetrapyrgos nigripes]|uniref:Major facilitator superfamily (MFS) profile domain-containing protein n=1 Tax=Tetrapyrgos nigripes TaxID=182062 RepID=A0A8H5CGQ6_9AGAR|nr:hypothetical protein D9758_012570 [Tetrapyrgos nigripes]